MRDGLGGSCVFRGEPDIDESKYLEHTFREELKGMDFNGDGPNYVTLPSKDGCHSPECSPDLYPLLPTCIGPALKL